MDTPTPSHTKTHTHTHTQLSVNEKFLAGATAGVVSQLCVFPLETIKTRLAAPGCGYRNVKECLLSTYRNGGIMALYRGVCASMIGVVPYAGIDMVSFETLKTLYTRHFAYDNEKRHPSVYVLLGCGALSSTTGQVVSYPLALIRTKMQADGMHGNPRQYKSMRSAFVLTLKEGGVRGLYRGLVPNLLKAVPAVSISWATYESLRNLADNRSV
eukprot:GHVR01149124.1.p1 GENE.GHVR01149124.1~~GHVR01149124.1.p1  ORF type:complete len:247 (-),score=76.30 GHVR01149124.1:148-786(-)